MSKQKKQLFGNIRQRGNSWQVDCGRINGKREQRSFKTKAEAEGWAQAKSNEVSNNRVAAFELNDRHRLDALNAYRAMATSLGIDVERLPTEAHSLELAIEFYLNHTKPAGGERKVADVVQEFLQGKISAGRRPRTIQDLTHRLTRFAKQFGQTPVQLVFGPDIEKWLNMNKYKGVTRLNYRRHLVSFFSYAKNRKYTSENPAEGLEIPILDEKTPGILTVSECIKLMHTAAEIEPDMVPYFAIALFAGLRPSEAEALDWKNIDFERKQIRVTPETAKKRRLRYVEMSNNLIHWLMAYRRESGTIFFLRKRFDRVRTKSGVKWAPDVLRHSFGSYHVAMHENAAKTSLQMGHRDTDVLFNHYRDLVSKADAEKFWDIKPEHSNILVMQQFA